jgi:hypothetical protein
MKCGRWSALVRKPNSPRGCQVVVGNALDGRSFSAQIRPMYWLMELLPPTRAGTRRLGLVTLEQMKRALVHIVENPCDGIRIVEVPEVRHCGGFSSDL